MRHLLHNLHRLLIVTLTVGYLPAFAQANKTTNALPDAPFVVLHILERAGDAAKNRQPFTYIRRATTEELDDAGHAESSKRKVYEVTQIGGVTTSRLLEVVGKDGKMQDAADQSKREEAAKERLAQSKKSGKRGRYDQLITDDLMNRFVWKVEERMVIDGRSLLLLSFKPRATGLNDDKLMDRVINRLKGTIRVDEQDWEIARVDLHLMERVTLWGGLLGSLDNFAVIMHREAGLQGVWYVKRTEVEIVGRKFLSNMRVRVKELSEDFKPADPADSR